MRSNAAYTRLIRRSNRAEGLQEACMRLTHRSNVAFSARAGATWLSLQAALAQVQDGLYTACTRACGLYADDMQVKRLARMTCGSNGLHVVCMQLAHGSNATQASLQAGQTWLARGLNVACSASAAHTRLENRLIGRAKLLHK